MVGYKQRAAASADGGAPAAQAPSALVALLLEKWAWGQISARQVQELCAAAQSDGLLHPHVLALSTIGSAGSNPNNCNRDLLTKLSAPMLSHAQSMHSFPMKHPRAGSFTHGQKLMLPHEVFANIYEHYPSTFRDKILGGEGELQKFWRSMRGSPLHDGHEVRDRPSYDTMAVPVSVHGDGVPVAGIAKAWCKSVDTWSWSSLVSQGTTVDCNFMIFLFFQSFAVDGALGSSMGTFWRLLCWSLKALWEGRWPAEDAFGKKYRRGSMEHKRANRPLAGGYFGVVLNLKGDLKYYAERLRLPWFSSNDPCAFCRCNASTRPWTDFRAAAIWRTTTWEPRAWEAAFPGRHDIFKVAGININAVSADLMHVKHMGTDAYFFGSVLAYLCYWKLTDTPQNNLSHIWSLLKEYNKDFGCVGLRRLGKKSLEGPTPLRKLWRRRHLRTIDTSISTRPCHRNTNYAVEYQQFPFRKASSFKLVASSHADSETGTAIEICEIT